MKASHKAALAIMLAGFWCYLSVREFMTALLLLVAGAPTWVWIKIMWLRRRK